MQWWTVPSEWKGQTAFILAGGASVAGQNTDLLKSRNVIAINSSWKCVPFAQFLYFSDKNWWDFYGQEAVNQFKGRIVTAQAEGNVQVSHARLLYLRRSPYAGVCLDRNSLNMRSTSLSAAVNLAVHLGSGRIVLLGADGRKADDGRAHHHAEYPWDLRTGIFEAMHEDLASFASSLSSLGIECVNASPGSAWSDLWPIVSLEDYLD